MKQTSTIISVGNPKSLDGGVLDTMFGSSQAISEAVSKFWKMDLTKSSRAELGNVTKTSTGYDVEIKYRAN